jgi:predicted nucleic acid-binding protein
MSRATLLAALTASAPLVVDTSVVLSYLNGDDVFSGAAAIVFDDLVAAGTHPATVSAVTVTECLVRPFRTGPAAVATGQTFLAHFANLNVRVIDTDVSVEAARVRALTGLRTPDALVIATALVEGIPTVVSADDRWRGALASFPALRLVHLKAHLPI